MFYYFFYLLLLIISLILIKKSNLFGQTNFNNFIRIFFYKIYFFKNNLNSIKIFILRKIRIIKRYKDLNKKILKILYKNSNDKLFHIIIYSLDS